MIKVNYRALGMLSTNCYVVENPDSQKVLIVDPGDSPLEIERQIDEIDGETGECVGRSFRDAPEIDGVVTATGAEDARPGDVIAVKITASSEYDLSGVAIHE